jgi:hypothetical protein
MFIKKRRLICLFYRKSEKQLQMANKILDITLVGVKLKPVARFQFMDKVLLSIN